MIFTESKRGVAPIVSVLTIFGVLVLIYLFLFLPIPAFKEFRYTINYWTILVAFFSIQAGLVYLYYSGVKFVIKSFNDIKGAVLGYTKRFKEFITFKFRV